VNLPKEANVALVEFLSASRRYGELMSAVSKLNRDECPNAMLEIEATIRDAEQALLAIFTAVLGEPDVEFPS
jgi:hypothetical protein